MLTAASLQLTRESVVPNFARVSADVDMLWTAMAGRVRDDYAAAQVRLRRAQHIPDGPSLPPPQAIRPPQQPDIQPQLRQLPRPGKTVDLPLLSTNLHRHEELLRGAQHALRQQSHLRTSSRVQQDLQTTLDRIAALVSHTEHMQNLSASSRFLWADHLQNSDRVIHMLLGLVTLGRPLAPPNVSMATLWGVSRVSPYSLLWKIGGVCNEASWLDSVSGAAGAASREPGSWVDLSRGLLGRWDASSAIGGDPTTLYPSDQTLYAPTFVDLYGRSYCYRGGSQIQHPNRLLRNASITLAVWDTAAASSYREVTKRESARHTVNTAAQQQQQRQTAEAAARQKRKRTESEPQPRLIQTPGFRVIPAASALLDADPPSVFAPLMGAGGDGSQHWWACRGKAESCTVRAGSESLVLFPNTFLWAYPKLSVVVMGLEAPLGAMNAVYSRVGERYRHQVVRVLLKDIAPV